MGLRKNKDFSKKYTPMSQDLDKLTGYKREEAQYLTDCLLSLYKLQSETEEIVIIDEGYISSNCSINNSTTASEK